MQNVRFAEFRKIIADTDSLYVGVGFVGARVRVSDMIFDFDDDYDLQYDIISDIEACINSLSKLTELTLLISADIVGCVGCDLSNIKRLSIWNFSPPQHIVLVLN
jgi:hypothetical protein